MHTARNCTADRATARQTHSAAGRGHEPQRARCQALVGPLSLFFFQKNIFYLFFIQFSPARPWVCAAAPRAARRANPAHCTRHELVYRATRSAYPSLWYQVLLFALPRPRALEGEGTESRTSPVCRGAAAARWPGGQLARVS